jgi:hypothetical protein
MTHSLPSSSVTTETRRATTTTSSARRSTQYRPAGLHLYNEAILVNMIGTGAMVAGSYMRSSRKMVKLHQNVLIFVKGDPKQATLRCGDMTVT